MSNKPKMTKDVVPNNFTLSLAIVDAIPVIFFGLTMVVVGKLFSSPLFILGAIISLLSGAVKVLWKVVVALKRKNIWWMFLQMRIAMPVGFLAMVISVIIGFSKINWRDVINSITQFPQLIFFVIGVIGMILMSVFAVKLDSSDIKSNWIEQATNGVAQICFFIGVLLILF